MKNCVETLVHVLGRGVLATEARARLQLLDDASQEELRNVRAHCRANRAAVQDDSLVDRLADSIAENFWVFISAWT